MNSNVWKEIATFGAACFAGAVGWMTGLYVAGGAVKAIEGVSKRHKRAKAAMKKEAAKTPLHAVK